MFEILGFLLFIGAYILFLPLSIINYFIVRESGYFKSSAMNLDRYINREFRTLFNMYLKTSEGCEFGSINETISSVLGKNQRDNTLTKMGKILAAILDFIDNDHCKNSIKID